MDTAEIATLIAYNIWANERILAACEKVSAQEFIQAATPDAGWGSLRGCLVHALDTEYGWRMVLSGLPATEILDESDFPDAAALAARWQSEHAAWQEYAAGLSAQSLNLPYDEAEQQNPMVWQTILHVLFHSAQHRSEAAALLTGFGQSPGEVDFLVYLDE